MDDERLLLDCDKIKTNDKSKKFQRDRAANALFCGIALGFIFSCFLAYNGLSDNNAISLQYTERAQKRFNKTNQFPTNLAEFLHGEIRVLCLVMTSSAVLQERGFLIMDTWGKRCNKILFFSEKLDPNFNNIVVLTTTAMLREALKYVYMNHIEDFDWILKTNDMSYVVLENLRYVLYQYETEWPIVMGLRYLTEDYMFNDYVLSRRAFTRLIEEAFTNPQICELTNANDDKQMATCLQHINVIKINGIDESGRGMFFQSNPESALFPEKFDEYDKWSWNKLKQGIDHCCSDRLIIIQNCYTRYLYYLEYFIYKVHVFGRHRINESLPQKLSLDEIVKRSY